MRLLIAGSAALVIGLIGVVFLLPVLVDRTAIEARLQRDVEALTGNTIAIERLDVQLLPSPQVIIAGAFLEGLTDARGRPAMAVDRIDLAVRPMPLLAGELVIDEARLVRPEFRPVTHAGDVLAGLDALLARATGQLTMNALSIVDGRLLLAAGTDDETVLGDVYLDWRLEADGGGSRGTLEARHAGSRIEAEAALGPLSSEGALSVQTRWRVDHGNGGAAAGAELSYRGTFGLAGSAERLSGNLALALDRPGVTAAWLEGLAGTALDLAAFAPALQPLSGQGVRLESQLGVSGSTLALDPLTLALGDQRVNGRLVLNTGERPRLDLALDGNALALAGPPEAPGLLFDLPARLPADVAGGVALRVNTVETPGAIWRRFSFEATLPGDGSIEVGELALGLPGLGRLDFEGVIERTTAGPRWQGDIELSSEDTGVLMAALDLETDEPPFELPERFDLVGTIELDRQRLGLRSSTLRFDASRAQGGLVLVRGNPTRLALTLSIDRLPLDAYLSRTMDRERLAELGRGFAAIDHALDLTIERATLGSGRFENIRLESRREEADRVHARLALGGLGGSSMNLEGRADLLRGRFEGGGQLNIASLSRLLRFFGVEPPAALVLAGPVLMTAEAAGDDESTRIELAIEADSFSGQVSTRLEPPLEAPRFAIDTMLQGEDGERILREFAGIVLTGDLVAGPARFDASIEGGLRDPVSVDLEARIGDLTIDGRLARAAGGDPRETEGALTFGPISADLLSRLYRGLAPTLGLVPGPPEAWPGAWPTASLVWIWPEDNSYAFDLTLRPENTDRSVRIGIRVAQGGLVLDPIQVPVGSGRLAGRLTLTSNGSDSEVDVVLTLEDIDASYLLDGVGGKLALEAEASGRGESIADLVASLDGDGSLALSGGRIAGLGAGSDIGLTLDPGGSLAFDELAGPLAIARGVVVGEALGLEFGGDSVPVDLFFDLKSWILEADITGPDSTIFRAVGPPGALDLRHFAPDAAE